MIKHHASYVNLLDDYRQRMGLKTDSAVAESLGYVVAVISNVRRGQHMPSAGVLIRMCDHLQLSPEGLKKYLGPDAYGMAVWGREPENSTQLDYAALDADPHYAAQTEVVSALTSMIKYGAGYAVLRCGQRSNKGVIAARVAHRLGAKRVFIMLQHPQISYASHFNVPVAFNQLPEVPAPGDIVIIDEPFQSSESFKWLNKAHRQAGLPVLAVGSNGPWFTDSWKAMSSFLSLSTWEINPRVTRESLQSLYDEDPVRAIRDYEGF